MDETTAACVDPNMIDVVSADVETRAKEHNITGQYSIQRHWMRRAPLLVSSSWHFQPCALVRIDHKSAAIEPLRVGPAKMIGSSDQLSSREHNRSTAFIGAIGRTWNAAAAGYEPDNEKREYAGRINAKRVSHIFDYGLLNRGRAALSNPGTAHVFREKVPEL